MKARVQNCINSFVENISELCTWNKLLCLSAYVLGCIYPHYGHMDLDAWHAKRHQHVVVCDGASYFVKCNLRGSKQAISTFAKHLQSLSRFYKDINTQPGDLSIAAHSSSPLISTKLRSWQ